MRKTEEYQRAISMRKAGKSYREILEVLPVAKSTLSLWLRSIGLANAQKQRLTQKRLNAIRRAAKQKTQRRLDESALLVQKGVHDVGCLSVREYWLIGTALYWAEGSKQHAHSPSVGVIFANSDVTMHRFFINWLAQMGISNDQLRFELFVHTSRANNVDAYKRWWSKQLRISLTKFDTVYFKKGNTKTKRHNVSDLYHGLLRIRVTASVSFNRKIQGWIEGIARAVKM